MPVGFTTADAAERLASQQASKKLGVSAGISQPLTYKFKRPGIYDILKNVPGPLLSSPVNTGAGVSMGGQQNAIVNAVEPTRLAVRRAVGDITAIPGVGKPSASPTAADIRSGNWAAPAVDYAGLAVEVLPAIVPAYQEAKRALSSAIAKTVKPTPIGILANTVPAELSNSELLRMAQRGRNIRFRQDQLPELFSSAHRYWGQDYPEFQNYLRDPKEMIPFLSNRELLNLKTDILKIDSLFDKAPPLTKPIVVYRGVKTNWGNNNSRFVQMLRDLKPGDVFSEPGFSSTTIDPGLGQGFADRGLGGYVLEIEVPQGTKTISPLHNWPSRPMNVDPEKEILLARNSRFEVISRNGNTIRLRLIK